MMMENYLCRIAKMKFLKKNTDSSCINLTNEHFLDFGISDLKVAMPKKAEKN
jgi:hypothetical protein